MDEAFERPAGVFGAEVFAAAAARNVGLARRLYERCAEAAERSINACEASAARTGAGLRAVAGANRGCDRWEREAAHRRKDLREMALRVMIASDTNVRAGFDCAERLVQARGPWDAFAVYAAYLREQAGRSARQALDLQRDLQRMAAEAALRHVSLATPPAASNGTPS